MDNKQFKVLLVDDDDLSRRMMSLLLAEQGFDFETASNGAEAVTAVQSQQFDFVLMDLQMPVMDGLEATRKIRSWESGSGHVPIFALTAMLFEDERNMCLTAGMDDCLMKPFNAAQLFQTIRSFTQKSTEQDKNGHTQDETQNELPLLSIRNALTRFNGNVQVYQDFLREFLDALPTRIDELQVAYSSSDFDLLSSRAHNLKGVAGSLGVMQLSNLALKLDQQSNREDLQLIQKTLSEIEENTAILQGEAMKALSNYMDNDVDGAKNR